MKQMQHVDSRKGQRQRLPNRAHCLSVAAAHQTSTSFPAAAASSLLLASQASSSTCNSVSSRCSGDTARLYTLPTCGLHTHHMQPTGLHNCLKTQQKMHLYASMLGDWHAGPSLADCRRHCTHHGHPGAPAHVCLSCLQTVSICLYVSPFCLSVTLSVCLASPAHQSRLKC